MEICRMETGYTLRSARPEDAAAILQIYAPFVTDSAVSFELELPSLAEMVDRMAHYQVTHPWLVCVLGDVVVGYAYGSAHRARLAYQWATEVSVYVAEGHQRAGCARALYQALFALLRAQGYTCALAGITQPNPKSVGFHAALGFHEIARYRNIGYKFGQWWDTLWMELDWSDGQAPVALRMPEELSEAEWERLLRG
jgi:L-amino acid N-acyltransferase YncA